MKTKCGYLYAPLESRNGKFGKMTVYYEWDGSFLRYAAAFCSPKDRFIKRIGRQIAYKRFLEGNYQAKSIRLNDIITKLKKHLWNGDVDLPSWVKYID
jgi:hypothetical protein